MCYFLNEHALICSIERMNKIKRLSCACVFVCAGLLIFTYELRMFSAILHTFNVQFYIGLIFPRRDGAILGESTGLEQIVELLFYDILQLKGIAGVQQVP